MPCGLTSACFWLFFDCVTQAACGRPEGQGEGGEGQEAPSRADKEGEAGRRREGRHTHTDLRTSSRCHGGATGVKSSRFSSVIRPESWWEEDRCPADQKKASIRTLYMSVCVGVVVGSQGQGGGQEEGHGAEAAGREEVQGTIIYLSICILVYEQKFKVPQPSYIESNMRRSSRYRNYHIYIGV